MNTSCITLGFAHPVAHPNRSDFALLFCCMSVAFALLLRGSVSRRGRTALGRRGRLSLGEMSAVVVHVRRHG